MRLGLPNKRNTQKKSQIVFPNHPNIEGWNYKKNNQEKDLKNKKIVIKMNKDQIWYRILIK
jgi:hypothetical protein